MPKRFKSSRIARHSNIPWLGRTRLMSHMQGALAKGKAHARFPLLAIFVQNPLPWLISYAKSVFHRRIRPYPAYALDGHDGVYPLRSHNNSSTIRLSIVADWGTGTEEAYRIAEQMNSFHADYTFHLGDVYYVGNEDEIQENFLGKQVTQNTPLKFPRGSVGTLTIPGNHEFYGGGDPYFHTVLPFASPAPGEPQRASFYALESEHWRILGLDTGYNSTGIPFLGSFPFISRIKAIGGDAHLEPEILDWLRTNVRPQERPKATLILSHHQYFTAFDDEAYPKPAAQLHEFFAGQEVLWLWGHEHRLAVYAVFSPDGNLRCHGRCIGHGGMPVETKPPNPRSSAPLLYRDPRVDYPIGNGDRAGWNGFVNAVLDGPRLGLEYRDIEGELLFHETFSALPDGTLQRSH